MQRTSELYQQILAGDHSVETRATIAGVTYGPDSLVAASTSGSLYQTMGIGSAAARQINLEIIPQGTIPKRAEIKLEVRLVSRDGETGEWIPKGTYFFSHRETDHVTGVMSVVGYDAMLKADQIWLDSTYDEEGWPMAVSAAVEDIAKRMEVDIDSRTALDEAYPVQYPADQSGDMTMRAVLRRIAVANGGNWCITDEGKLRLVPLVMMEPVHKLGDNAEDLMPGLATDPISGVVLLNESGEVMGQAGDETGRTLEALEPDGTDAMAVSILAAVGGYVYQPYEATNALLDPAAELGDLMDIAGLTSVIARADESFGPLYTADISAPTTDEIEDEYPYLTRNQRVQRAIATNRSLITKTAEQIGLKVIGLEDKYTELKVTLDGVTVTDGSGTTKIKGSSIETGTLYVDAANITGTLTAEQVEINLSGAIAFKDLSDADAKQAEIDAANTNASSAAKLAATASNTVSSWTYSGSTYIDGSKIMTGTVMASKLLGGTVGLLAADQTQVGSISIAYTTTGIGLGISTSYGGIQIVSGGNLFLQSSGGEFATLGNGYVSLGGGPLVLSAYSYGTSLPSTGTYGQLFFLLES